MQALKKVFGEFPLSGWDDEGKVFYISLIIRERALENALAPSPIAGSERADKLHLFVNGNNQTQRAFLSQLARCATFPSFGRVGPDDLTISAIRAASVLDDFLFLKELFDEIVSK